MSRYLGCLPSIAPTRACSAARRHGPRQRWARDPVRRMTQVAMLKHAARLGQPIPAIDGPEWRTLRQIGAEAAEAGHPVVFVGRSGILEVTTAGGIVGCSVAIPIGLGGVADPQLEPCPAKALRHAKDKPVGGPALAPPSRQSNSPRGD